MTAAVAVVVFGAGGGRFAIASADVARLDDRELAADDLAAVLALAPTPAAAVRVLAVTDGVTTRALAVDGPVRITTVTAAQVVPCPPGLAAGPVLGFAIVDGELVQLLDTTQLVAGPRPTAAGAAGAASPDRRS